MSLSIAGDMTILVVSVNNSIIMLHGFATTEYATILSYRIATGDVTILIPSINNMIIIHIPLVDTTTTAIQSIIKNIHIRKSLKSVEFITTACVDITIVFNIIVSVNGGANYVGAINTSGYDPIVIVITIVVTAALIIITVVFIVVINFVDIFGTASFSFIVIITTIADITIAVDINAMFSNIDIIRECFAIVTIVSDHIIRARVGVRVNIVSKQTFASNILSISWSRKTITIVVTIVILTILIKIITIITIVIIILLMMTAIITYLVIMSCFV